MVNNFFKLSEGKLNRYIAVQFGFKVYLVLFFLLIYCNDQTVIVDYEFKHFSVNRFRSHNHINV